MNSGLVGDSPSLALLSALTVGGLLAGWQEHGEPAEPRTPSRRPDSESAFASSGCCDHIQTADGDVPQVWGLEVQGQGPALQIANFSHVLA